MKKMNRMKKTKGGKMGKEEISGLIVGKGEYEKHYGTGIDDRYDKIVEVKRKGVAWFELYRKNKLEGRIKESCVERIWYENDDDD